MKRMLSHIGLAMIVIVGLAYRPGTPGLTNPTLVNGSFNDPFITWNIDGRNEHVAYGWTPFIEYYDNPPGPPEFRRNDSESRDGPPSQWVWSTYNSYRCGIYQTVGGFTPGESYTFQVWILSIYGAAGGDPVPGDNIGKQLAVDQAGGTDWLAPGLFRGPDDFRDRWAYFSYLSFTAESPTATLFIHINNRWAGENCQALWDAARLYTSPTTATNWSQVAPLPSVTTADSFPVHWGLVTVQRAGDESPSAPPPSPPAFYSYDVQYRVDGGPWTTWLTNTLTTSAVFGAGSPVTLEPRQTYAFRCRTHDAAGGTNEGRTWGWVETYPATPDAQTTVGWTVAGRVLNNRADGVPGAVVALAASPAFTGTAGALGEFQVHVPATGTYTLTLSAAPAIAGSSYGALPPIYHLAVLTDVAGLDLLLPPADDVVQNGDFEGSDPLAGWHVGGDVPPTVTASAASVHTGHAATQLGSGAGVSWLTQTVFLSDTPISPTLSFAYAFSTTVPSDTFDVWVQGAGGPAITVTQTSTPAGWSYVTGDLGSLTGTVTLHFRVHQSSPARTTDGSAPAFAWVDEVHLGARAGPLEHLYLPLVRRS